MRIYCKYCSFFKLHPIFLYSFMKMICMFLTWVVSWRGESRFSLKHHWSSVKTHKHRNANFVVQPDILVCLQFSQNRGNVLNFHSRSFAFPLLCVALLLAHINIYTLDWSVLKPLFLSSAPTHGPAYTPFSRSKQLWLSHTGGQP